MPADTVIQIRKGNTNDWLTSNPVLSSGEPGYDLDSNILKVGDGQQNWSNLSPVGANISSGSVCSPFSSGQIGQIKIDSNFLYACVANNSWKRVSLSSWTDTPSSPLNLAASPLDSSAYVSWETPVCDGGDNISNYHLQYSLDNEVSWNNYSTISDNSLFSIVSGLNNGSSYVFRIAAINSAGTGVYSSHTSNVLVSGDPYYYNTRLLLSFN